MSVELDTNFDNLIDANLLGTGTKNITTFLRGDQVFSSVYSVGGAEPVDQTLIWLDTSGV